MLAYVPRSRHRTVGCHQLLALGVYTCGLPCAPTLPMYPNFYRPRPPEITKFTKKKPIFYQTIPQSFQKNLPSKTLSKKNPKITQKTPRPYPPKNPFLTIKNPRNPHSFPKTRCTTQPFGQLCTPCTHTLIEQQTKSTEMQLLLSIVTECAPRLCPGVVPLHPLPAHVAPSQVMGS